jgi:hypothetical protein
MATWRRNWPQRRKRIEPIASSPGLAGSVFPDGSIHVERHLPVIWCDPPLFVEVRPNFPQAIFALPAPYTGICHSATARHTWAKPVDVFCHFESRRPSVHHPPFKFLSFLPMDEM